MIGGQQQSRPQPQSEAPKAAASAEEEALRRNTDCVYFLASPLTCKKGSECEYRHSDVARVNPRDCWFWLNGNCLNPKCGFRHPPLDKFPGAQVPTPSGAAAQAAAATPAQPSYAPAKQGVQCVYFQKGYCMKGDRCPFMHNNNSNKATPPPLTATTTTLTATSTPTLPVNLISQPPSLKNGFGVLEKCSQEKKNPQNNIPKSGHSPPAKPAHPPPLKPAVAKSETAAQKSWQLSHLEDEILNNSRRSRDPSYGHLVNRNLMGGPNPAREVVDEFSREPSPPGFDFDVLVADDRTHSDYYREGRGLNSDAVVGSDFNLKADVDRDLYRDCRGGYGWEEEKRRASSDRVVLPPPRRYPRSEQSDPIDESDLRNRLLSKQRRGNGLRSVVSQDYPDRINRRVQPQPEGSRSNRLRGRIKMPARSPSPVNRRSSDIHSNPTRIQDRIKGRNQEDYSNDGRNFRGQQRTRNDMKPSDFAAPKSLATLKAWKNGESSDRNGFEQQLHPLGKRKFSSLDGNHQSEGVSFEGPMPLSEILKRKRQVERSGSSSNNNEENNKASAISESKSPANFKGGPSEEDGFESSLQNPNPNLFENEEGMIVAETAEDQEIEPYDDQREEEEEGEYDYDQVEGEGEEYNLGEGENAEEEEEYLEDEDADDFAKKMGVVFS